VLAFLLSCLTRAGQHGKVPLRVFRRILRAPVLPLTPAHQVSLYQALIVLCLLPLSSQFRLLRTAHGPSPGQSPRCPAGPLRQANVSLLQTRRDSRPQILCENGA